MSEQDKKKEELREAMRRLKFGGGGESMLGGTPSEIDHEDEFAKRPKDQYAAM